MDKGTFFSEAEGGGYGEDCAEGFYDQHGEGEEGGDGEAGEDGFYFGDAGAGG